MTEAHIAIQHPTKEGKWCVVAYLGECSSVEEAKKLAEEVAPKLGELLK